MVGSIDPRCETVRGTHWPKAGRRCVWNSRRGKPSWPAVKRNRINRPDIWMQAIRSNQKKLLWHGGRPHMGPGVRRDDSEGADGLPPPVLMKSLYLGASLHLVFKWRFGHLAGYGLKSRPCSM